MMNLNDLFMMGMKRVLLPPVEPPKGIQIELGPGESPTEGADGLAGWRAPGRIPYADSTVAAIWAFHFFEHLAGEDAIKVLHDCDRILVPGGVLTALVPHRLSQMAYHDLDHKSFWCEGTLKNLFQTEFYTDKGEWSMRLHTCVIMGIVERNLALIFQLVKQKQ